MCLFTKEKSFKSPLFSWNDPKSHKKVVEKLQMGETLLASGDTVLGLLCQVLPSCFDDLNRIKGRYEKPYLLLIASQSQARDFISVAPDVERIMSIFWPGPLTIIGKASPQAPVCAQSSFGTIAVRVPAHEGLLSILSHFRGLFSTSANSSGKQVAQCITRVEPEIIDGVGAIILDDRCQSIDAPSTIIDCSTEHIKLIREGAYARAIIQAHIICPVADATCQAQCL